MAGINFITSNPATDEFRKAEEAARETASHGLKMRSGLRQEDEADQTWGDRRRRVTAETDLTVTRAGVAKAEAPYAAPMAATRLRQATAAATHAELQDWYKANELLEQGQHEAAQEVARRVGKPLPQAAISNAAVRQGIAAINKRAQELYPDRPRMQQTYITSQMQVANARIKDNKEDPAVVWGSMRHEGVYAMPDGAPTPPDTKTTFANRFEALPKKRINPDTGKEEIGYVPFDRTNSEEGEFRPGEVLGKRGGGGAAGGGRLSVFQQKRAGWLEVYPGDEKGALDFANNKKTMSEPDIAKWAIAAAQRDIANDKTLQYNSVKRGEALKQKIREYTDQMRQINMQPAPAPAPGSGLPPAASVTGISVEDAPVRPPAAPGPSASVSPGNGQKPANVAMPPRPPSVPAGSGYSPSTRTWFTRDGRKFDQNGTPL
jgi:hypothetical protein